MAKPKEIPVKNLSDYTEAIEENLAASRARHPDSLHVGNWYRGCGLGISHKLNPHLYRHPKIKKIEGLLELERRMLEDFRRHSVLQDVRGTFEGLDWRFQTLFFMQHYGVPTRLLDWTGNPFIGLYFALTSAEKKDGKDEYKEDAAVWILDPVSWNEKALEELAWKDRGPALPDDTEIKSYYPRAKYSPTDIKQMYDLPVATLGVANNTRMFAQKGVFTIFGKKLDAMERVYESESYPVDCLVKLVIEKADIDELLATLSAIGYTDSVSYPDLHGIALEIKRLHGFGM